MTRTTKHTQLSLVQLEGREVPATINMGAGGVVKILGDDSWSDRATVSQADGQVVVRMESTHFVGRTLLHRSIERRFDPSAVQAIQFWGKSGNDSFLGAVDVPCTAFGGAGSDRLEGANAADIFHGGTGNDLLIGNGGEDRLFGDAGDDTLWGGLGQDILIGGTGNDVIQQDLRKFDNVSAPVDSQQHQSREFAATPRPSDTRILPGVGTGLKR